MLHRVEMDVCQYLCSRNFFQRFGSWADGAPVLADVVVLAELWDRNDYRFVPYFRYLSIWEWQIEDVSSIVNGTMSEHLVVEGAHPARSDRCGRFGQWDRFPLSAGVIDDVPFNGSWWICRLRCLLNLSPATRFGGGVNWWSNLFAIFFVSR